MEIYRYAVLLVFYKVLSVTGTFSIQCRRSNNCFCTSTLHEHEFRCPNEKSPKVIIKVQPKVINIQCVDTINWKDADFPLIETKTANHIVMLNCWLPANNFAQVMNVFGINSSKVLTLDVSANFTNITMTLDYFEDLHNLKKLIIHDSDVKYVAEDAFKSLDKLIELNLRNNNINLFDDLFKHLQKLKFLGMSDNNLSHLPSQLFQNLTELKHLRLGSNKFTTLNSSTFKNLRSLELLDLSHNQLENLPMDTFHDLKNLKSVSLSRNNLESIPENLFTKNTLLEFVNMSRNPNLTYVPNNLFSNLTKLDSVFLSDCKISYLPANLFDGSMHLKNISLRENEIELIPEKLFKDSGELENLDLGHNKIKTLSNEVFALLTQLKSLNLESNLLTVVKEGFFQRLQRLELLNLRNNKINFIDVRSFRRIVNLKKIVLANNNLNLPMGQILSYNFELEKIDLSHNNITTIDGYFAIKVGLRELDLSYNQITHLKFSNLMTVSFPIKINLKHNNISSINFEYAETIIARSRGNFYQYPSIGLNREVYLDENPIHCDCHLYSFARYIDRTINPAVKIIVDNLTCASPKHLVDFPVRELTPNMLTCPLQRIRSEANCPEKCSCEYRPYDKSLIVSCIEANLTEVPKLTLPTNNFFNHVEVYLQKNLLTSGPKENMGYENVTKLFLSSNRINEVTWVPPKIRVLQLDNNNIQHLDGNVLAMLNMSSVANITLGNNPFGCDCSIEDLRTYVISHLLTKKVQIDVNNIKCKNGEELLAFTNEYCPPYMDIIIGFSILLFLLVLGIAILTFFWARGRKGTIFKLK